MRRSRAVQWGRGALVGPVLLFLIEVLRHFWWSTWHPHHSVGGPPMVMFWLVAGISNEKDDCDCGALSGADVFGSDSPGTNG